MTKLIIVNRRPGMIRGGKAHPAVAEHLTGAFSHAQWADIVGEPELTVVAGAVVTHATLADHVPAPDAAKKPAKA